MLAFLSRMPVGGLAFHFVLFGALFAGFPGRASAQTDYYWNAPTGGSGTWNTSSPTWSTSPSGPLNYSWQGSTNPNTTERANFLGYTGTVSVATSFSAQGLVFGASVGDQGY